MTQNDVDALRARSRRGREARLEDLVHAREYGRQAAQEARGDLRRRRLDAWPAMGLIQDLVVHNTDRRAPDPMEPWELTAAILETLATMDPADQARVTRAVLDEHLAMCQDEGGECARRRAFLRGFLEECVQPRRGG
jgi:hypothetical protein